MSQIFYSMTADNVELQFRTVDSPTTYGERVPVAQLTVWSSGIDPMTMELDRDRAQQLGRALLEGFPEDFPGDAQAWVADPSLPEDAHDTTASAPAALTRDEIVSAYRRALQHQEHSMLAELASIYPFLRAEPTS